MRTRSSAARRLSGVFLRGKVFWYRYSLGGRQHRISLETEDEAEAVAKATEIRAHPELADINHLQLEIEGYVKHQQAEGRFTRNSVENRLAVLTRWAEYMDVSEPREINTDAIQKWYGWLKGRRSEPLTESTAQSYVIMVRGFFNHLLRQGKIRANPVVGVRLARLENNTRRQFCDPALTQRLIDNCADKELRFVLYCGFHAGLRKEEIIQARPEWFNLIEGLLHITRSADWVPKDKDERTIPLTQAFKSFLVGELCDEAGHLPGPYIIAPNTVQRKSRYRYDFRKPFFEYMKQQRCPLITPHVMRHTFASLLASRGVSIYKVAKWLGDGVEVTQKHYAHLLPKDDDIEKGFVAPAAEA